MSEKALQCYLRYSRIWYGRSDEIISVSAALHELGMWEARLQPGKLCSRISDLIDDIIINNRTPNDTKEVIK